MAEFQLERLALDGDRALHGLSSGLDKAQIAIHVHGTWGNFYENTIATAFADLYASFGYGFATVNVPGHDSESTSEVFEESLQALALWADHLAPTGNILWQAHSLGALKVVKLLEEASDQSIGDRTNAVVLLSIFDLPAFYARSASKEVIAARAQTASAAVSQGRGDELVSTDEFDIWPITYRTWGDALTRGGTLDLFPSADGDAGAIKTWSRPTLVAIGGADFAATPSPEEVVELVADQASDVDCHLIPAAPHNFAGHEEELAKILGNFLQRLPA